MKLEQAADKFVKMLRLQPNETVLVITDKERLEIGEALLRSTAPNSTMLVIPLVGNHSQEPETYVGKQMLESDVILCPTTYSLTHTSAARTAKQEGKTVITMPGITEAVFVRGATEDYKKVQAMNTKLARALEKTQVVKVKSKEANLTVVCQDRTIVKDDGKYEKRPTLSNFPAGETGFAPSRGLTNGWFIVNKSQFCEKGTKISIDNGFVSDIQGDIKFKRMLFNIPNGRNIAEFSIGTNNKAKITGNVLEDEKVLGTCHIAFGDSKSLGGEVTSNIHLDFVIQKPDIWFNAKQVMKTGKLRLK